MALEYLTSFSLPLDRDLTSREAQIRRISRGVALDVGTLIECPILPGLEKVQDKMYNSLKRLHHEFMSMGITPEMHTGNPLHLVIADEVMATEYLAGQLLPLTNRRIISKHEMVLTLREFGCILPTGGLILEPESPAFAKLQDFSDTSSRVLLARQWLWGNQGVVVT